VSVAPRLRPFPWGALEPVTRLEAAALREVRGWARGHADLGRLPAALAELVDAKVDVIVRRAGPLTVARGLEGGGGVVLAPSDAPQLERGVLVEAELALVASVVARAARHKAPPVLEPGATASPGVVGAFAAVLVAGLRRANAGLAMRAVAAGPAVALEADLARLGRELWVVSLTVLVGDDAFEARVVLPRSAALASPVPAWDAAALAALGATPVALSIVAHVVTSTATELALLRRGDALVLDGWPLTRGASGALAGPVALAAPSSATGIAARLGDDGGLVLRGEAVPLGAAEEEMADTDRGGLIEAVGEAPLTVRVEIGEARLAAREWAALGRGDVVALGRRVGEPVLVRVGGVPVARGELVEIDGEVAVRIVERLPAEGV
jgi:flagellar motor switch/type III secretory pathway protein FliN